MLPLAGRVALDTLDCGAMEGQASVVRPNSNHVSTNYKENIKTNSPLIQHLGYKENYHAILPLRTNARSGA